MHARTHTRNVYGLLGNLERSAVHYRFSRQLYQLCSGIISNIQETIRGYIAFLNGLSRKWGTIFSLNDYLWSALGDLYVTATLHSI